MEDKMLPTKWIDYLKDKPESGMGYQIVTVTLKDGKSFDNVAIIQSALIGEVKGYNEIPFEPEDIVSIEVKPYQKYWGNK